MYVCMFVCMYVCMYVLTIRLNSSSPRFKGQELHNSLVNLKMFYLRLRNALEFAKMIYSFHLVLSYFF